MERMRIVIAEDNLLVRTGLVSLLAAEHDMAVVAACSTLEELLAEVDQSRPDVVITDIRMPPSFTDEGVRAARDLRTRHPEIGVVLLSQFLDPTYLQQLIAEGSGRRGYLLKERLSAPGQLATALRAVASGGSFIDPLVVDALMSAQARQKRSPLDRLTPRERATLSEIANGRSNMAIAQQLHVSERAVEKHIASIFSKLDLPDDRDINRRVKAVVMFLSQGP